MYVEISAYQKDLYKVVGIAEEKRVANDRIVIPMEQIENLTEENRQLLIEHLPLALPCIQKVSETSYKFVHSVDNAKALKLQALQNRTRQVIASRIPDWKLNRIRSYYSLSKKVQEKGIDSLDEIERIEYNVFPSVGETHEECFDYARTILQWVFERIKTHGEIEQQITKTTNIAGLSEINIEKVKYPKWQL